MLRLEAISKGYPAAITPILDRLQLSLGSHEYLAIMGESGSGKSTLLNLIAGLDRPDSGSVRFGDTVLSALSDDDMTRWRRAHLGFVFQAFHVLPYLSVLQNVELPLALLGVRAAQRRLDATRMLEACGMGALAARYPRELSGGELQRIAIARALVHRPRLVLADEPTGNLDAHTGQRIIELMFEMNRTARTTLVLVTHEQVLAGRCSRILHMDAGRLVTP